MNRWRAVGLEDVLLLVGTACLAYAASFVHPAGPVVVVGVMCLLAGIVLALPARRS